MSPESNEPSGASPPVERSGSGIGTDGTAGPAGATEESAAAQAARSPESSVAEGSAAAEPSEAELESELAAARRERDDALEKLDRRGRRKRLARKARHGLLGALVVIFSVLLPLTVTLGWVRTSIGHTSGWVRTVGPIPSEPAVANALGTELTNEVFAALQVQQRVAAALPPQASFVAGPVTNGVRGYVQQGMTTVIQSPQFHTLWVQANTFAHAQLIAVLQGNSSAVKTTGGQVVLDLVPLLNAGLSQLQGVISGIVGKPVNLPTIGPNDVPASACERIGAALGTTLPSNCAQIPLFPADKLTQAQDLYRLLHNGITALFVITPILAVVTVWISDRRRRTTLQLLGGGVIGLVIFRRAVIWLRSTLISTGKPANKEARQAILAHVLHGFFLATTWFLIGFLIAAVILAVTGPYGWAAATRRTVAKYAVAGWAAALALGGKATSPETTEWIGGHIVLLQVAGAVLAFILILALPVSYIGVLIILVLLAAYEYYLERIKRRPAAGGTEIDLTDRPPSEHPAGPESPATPAPATPAGPA